jgi:hypothetical protein
MKKLLLGNAFGSMIAKMHITLFNQTYKKNSDQYWHLKKTVVPDAFHMGYMNREILISRINFFMDAMGYERVPLKLEYIFSINYPIIDKLYLIHEFESAARKTYMFVHSPKDYTVVMDHVRQHIGDKYFKGYGHFPVVVVQTHKNEKLEDYFNPPPKELQSYGQHEKIKRISLL